MSATATEPGAVERGRDDLQPRSWRSRLQVVAGVALLCAAALLLGRQLLAPAPYRYVPAAGPPSAVPASLTGLDAKAMTVVSSEDGSVLADFTVVDGNGGPVLVDWRARVDDPLLYLPPNPDEVKSLAAAIERHVDAGTPVLAWWDTSRQLRLWSTRDVVFDAHLAMPLFAPPAWQTAGRGLARVETAFWGERDPAAEARFAAFVDALTSTEADGTAKLRMLAQGRRALLVLHLRDMILLGQLQPARVGVAFRDFADAGDVHRSVRGVHGWLREDGSAAYGVISRADRGLRVLALTDEATGDTLAARLLPFIGNRQEDVAGLTLVHRVGGFSVFELAEAGPAVDATRP